MKYISTALSLRRRGLRRVAPSPLALRGHEPVRHPARPSAHQLRVQQVEVGPRLRHRVERAEDGHPRQGEHRDAGRRAHAGHLHGEGLFTRNHCDF